MEMLCLHKLSIYKQANKQTNKQAATTSLPARDSLIC